MGGPMCSLISRVARLEGTGSGADLCINAVDRPARETREEWVERMAQQWRGEPHESGRRNAHGETRAEWTARRRRELEMTP
jgi:hypothetical protein